MELTDALIISFTGYTVVFIGLVLTALIISSFSFIPNTIRKLKERREAAKQQEQIREASKPVDPEIIAVIAAVLEIERRLYYSEKYSKFTFKERRYGSGLL